MNTDKIKKQTKEIAIKNVTLPKDERSYLEDFTPSLIQIREDFVKVCERGGFSGCAVEVLTPSIINAMKNAMLGRPLEGVRDRDEYWTYLNYGDNIKYQHKEDSRFFKDADGKITCVDAVVYRDQNGDCFTGDCEGTSNFVITKLPLQHKTFYIDVVSWEPKRDWWNSLIKDPAQLKAVGDYYGSKIEVPYRPFRIIECWFWSKFQKLIRKR